jgi:hypothetical protein
MISRTSKLLEIYHFQKWPTLTIPRLHLVILFKSMVYEESVVDKFKSNLLLMIFWLNIINYNS